MKTGIELIAAERARQTDKIGYKPEDDARHENAELALAACAYALPYETEIKLASWSPGLSADMLFKLRGWELWPWGPRFYRAPSIGQSREERVRQLSKAGALIAAEIDRLNTPNESNAVLTDRESKVSRDLKCAACGGRGGKDRGPRKGWMTCDSCGGRGH